MFDAYSRRARLAPLALAAAPAAFLLAGSLSAIERTGAILGFVVSAIGLAACGLVRDRGLAIQPSLWESWGGAPTTRLLRWRGEADRHATGRRHALLGQILGEPLPSEAEESADPDGADSRYRTAVSALRDLTRNRGFTLIEAENREYGYRRNSLGLKPIALGVAASCFFLSLALGLLNDGLARFLAAAGVSLVALAFWIVVVKSAWVRRAADLYAFRLLEAAESLGREKK
jgi:hypothetical protein